MANGNNPSFTGSNGPQSGTSGYGGSRNSQAPDMLQGVAQGAHKTIDRLAERATPTVQRLQQDMSGATEMLEERADQIREMSDEWMETLRCTVRENPLAAVGTALAVGVLIARLSR